MNESTPPAPPPPPSSAKPEIYATALEARRAGLLGEADLDHHHPLPGAEPAGYVGREPFFRRQDLMTVKTRKAWKRKGRRVAPDEKPVKALRDHDRKLALFSEAQTLSEEEYLELHRERMERLCALWGKRWEDLLSALAEWSRRLPGLGGPEGERELTDLLYQRMGLLDERKSLTGPADTLVIPLAEPAETPWLKAVESYRAFAFKTLVEEEGIDDRELADQVHRQLIDVGTERDGPLAVTPYWKYYGRFQKIFDRLHFEREAASATRIREFHSLFPAREIERRFTLFLGPTNSGKTYQALQRLKEAKNGAYLAPLRLLALEVSETLNEWGVPCNMVTGEERIPVEGAQHTASTIEMLSLHKRYEVCVIDEAQMLGDPDRGWAWTQAILGVKADEVCVIGAPESLPALEKLLKLTDEPYEVVELERMTPLTLMKKPLTHFEELEPGTALVAFSRSAVLGLKAEVERQTGKRAAVVYGALPPEVRRLQAKLFATGEAPYLVATDAIGMGLNLPIQTVLFCQDSKFYDKKEHPLTPMEVRQVGGRAGRYGKNERGFVGSFQCALEAIRTAWHAQPARIARAHLAPNLDHLLAIAALSDQRKPNLARLFTLFTRSVKPDPKVYRHADLEDQTVLARIADKHTSLDLETRFALSAAPVPLRNTGVVSAFETMVDAVGRNRPLPLETVLPSIQGQDFRRLQELEEMVQIVNLYAWLHYRFPDIFPDLDRAAAARQSVNGQIDRLLARSRKLGRHCSVCGQGMPPTHPHGICDACFKNRRGGGGRRRGAPSFGRGGGRHAGRGKGRPRKNARHK